MTEPDAEDQHPERINFDEAIRGLLESPDVRPISAKKVEQIEWDIATNLPLYTKDFFTLYGIDGHVCECHRGPEQCYGCEARDCKFHDSHPWPGLVEVEEQPPWIRGDYGRTEETP